MSREDREFYKSISICPYCRKNRIMGAENICPECLAYFAEKNSERYAKFGRKNADDFKRKQREKYRDRVESNVCTRCGKKTKANRKKCPACLEKDRIVAMRYRERKMLMGQTV